MTHINKSTEIELRDYFAANAMLCVMQETQEMKVASFWDWCKHLMVSYLYFTFLTVKFVKVENAYAEAAERAYEYADAMMLAKSKTNQTKCTQYSLKTEAKQM